MTKEFSLARGRNSKHEQCSIAFTALRYSTVRETLYTQGMEFSTSYRSYGIEFLRIAHVLEVSGVEDCPQNTQQASPKADKIFSTQ